MDLSQPRSTCQSCDLDHEIIITSYKANQKKIMKPSFQTVIKLENKHI